LRRKARRIGWLDDPQAEGNELRERLAECAASPKQVERLTRHLGAESVAERKAVVVAYQAWEEAKALSGPGGKIKWDCC
jgi:hypothetical protein